MLKHIKNLPSLQNFKLYIDFDYIYYIVPKQIYNNKNFILALSNVSNERLNNYKIKLDISGDFKMLEQEQSEIINNFSKLRYCSEIII